MEDGVNRQSSPTVDFRGRYHLFFIGRGRSNGRRCCLVGGIYNWRSLRRWRKKIWRSCHRPLGISYTWSVPEVSCELWNKSKVSLLARGVWRSNAGHGSNERLVISKESELPTFEQKTEMPDGEECREELPVERGIPGLSGRELFWRKKAKCCQPFSHFCCKTPPTCESDASTARERTACGAGWQSGTAATRAALAVTKAA